MKSYAVSVYPTDEKGKWLQDEGVARIDVLAESEMDAKLRAIERMAAGSDGERSRVLITISKDFQHLTLEHEEGIRQATVVVAENKDLIMSNLFIEEA